MPTLSHKGGKSIGFLKTIDLSSRLRGKSFSNTIFILRNLVLRYLVRVLFTVEFENIEIGLFILDRNCPLLHSPQVNKSLSHSLGLLMCFLAAEKGREIFPPFFNRFAVAPACREVSSRETIATVWRSYFHVSFLLTLQLL